MTSEPTAEAVCAHCEATDDLRPYGPGGAPVCFTCATATPKRERDAERAYSMQAEAAGIVGGGVITIGTRDGPAPGPPTTEPADD